MFCYGKLDELPLFWKSVSVHSVYHGENVRCVVAQVWGEYELKVLHRGDKLIFYWKCQTIKSYFRAQVYKKQNTVWIPGCALKIDLTRWSTPILPISKITKYLLYIEVFFFIYLHSTAFQFKVLCWFSNYKRVFAKMPCGFHATIRA